MSIISSAEADLVSCTIELEKEELQQCIKLLNKKEQQQQRSIQQLTAHINSHFET